MSIFPLEANKQTAASAWPAAGTARVRARGGGGAHGRAPLPRALLQGPRDVSLSTAIFCFSFHVSLLCSISLSLYPRRIQSVAAAAA